MGKKSLSSSCFGCTVDPSFSRETRWQTELHRESKAVLQQLHCAVNTYFNSNKQMECCQFYWNWILFLFLKFTTKKPQNVKLGCELQWVRAPSDHTQWYGCCETQRITVSHQHSLQDSSSAAVLKNCFQRGQLYVSETTELSWACNAPWHKSASGRWSPLVPGSNWCLCPSGCAAEKEGFAGAYAELLWLHKEGHTRWKHLDCCLVVQ